MENATTVIVPVGDFTSAIMRKVVESFGEASAHGRAIVISLQWTARWSWDALCQLAESLHGRYRNARVCFTGVPPARLALLREVGLNAEWSVDEPLPGAARQVLIAV